MGLVFYTLVLATFVTLLWILSSVARYYIKFTFFCVCSLFGAMAPIPLMLLKPRDSKNALIPAATFRLAAKALGLSYKVEGHENIITNSGCVVLINHQSILDITMLGYLWPIMDNCTIISKKEVLYLPVFGLACWLWGTIFINRSDSQDSRGKVSKLREAIKNKQFRILMFPEGTRNLGNKKLLPFKKGGFHLAVEAGCPIQPVVVSRYNTFLGKHRFEKGEIIIKILPAISTENYNKDNLAELIDKTYEVMNKNVDQISSDDNTKIKSN